jgi:hypothetical protein
MFEVEDPEPIEAEASLAPTPPIAADEMLDVREALAGDGWWAELAGRSG